MKKIITWIKPTWNWLHIWNYFWAIKPFLEVSKNNESYIFIADFHALTSVHDWKLMSEYKRNILLQYFSLIPEDANITIFEQSAIEKINNIYWILWSVTPHALMLRAHSYKDSKAKNIPINMATFNYPILMAADIIAYDIDLVPVWKDQVQHVEFARDIAGNFNKTYKTDFFKLPQHFLDEELMIIPGTDWRKMSKSYNNFIPIFWTEKEIKKKIMKIETDNTPLNDPKNPENCNIFKLIQIFWEKEKVEEIRQKYLAWWYWYWHAKWDLLELFLEYFKDARKKYEELQKNPESVYEKLKEANKKMNWIVNKKYSELKKIVWI